MIHLITGDTGDNWEIRSKDVLNKLNWLPLNQLRLTDTLLFMRKILKDEVPISISDQFQLSVNNNIIYVVIALC